MTDRSLVNGNVRRIKNFFMVLRDWVENGKRREDGVSIGLRDGLYMCCLRRLLRILWGKEVSFEGVLDYILIVVSMLFEEGLDVMVTAGVLCIEICLSFYGILRNFIVLMNLNNTMKIYIDYIMWLLRISLQTFIFCWIMAIQSLKLKYLQSKNLKKNNILFKKGLWVSSSDSKL